MGVLELGVTFKEFAVLQLHVMKLYYTPMKSMFN